MTAERDRLTAARAEYAELRASLLRGELVKVADLSSEAHRAVVESRGLFLALPHRLSARLGLTRSQSLELDNEVRDLLQSAADEGTHK